MSDYIGRFAPSPTGPLHAGSIATALASWLDARAHGGRWLLRIEDIDRPRNVPGAQARIHRQLAFIGLTPDAPPLVQSERDDRYQAALDQLQADGWLYGCACTRSEIARAIFAQDPSGLVRHREPIYPGTCRQGLPIGRTARAWRFRVAPGDIRFMDRWLGPQQQWPVDDTGDFVVRRADGLWAYQLAVVVDDAASGITDVVRGQDLLTSTGRQIQLQRALALTTPRYLHVPLVLGVDGEKLSKQNGATAVADGSGLTPGESADPCEVLDQAITVLGLEAPTTRDRDRWLAAAIDRWADRFSL